MSWNKAVIARGTGLFQTERHDFLTECAPPTWYGDEGRLCLIFLGQPDLVVAWETVHEWEPLMSGRWVDEDIYDGEREVILWTRFVEVAKVDADSHASSFFATGTILYIQSESSTVLMKPACDSFMTSSFTFCCMSGGIFLNFCLPYLVKLSTFLEN